jgi:hypothetical protein
MVSETDASDVTGQPSDRRKLIVVVMPTWFDTAA